MRAIYDGFNSLMLRVGAEVELTVGKSSSGKTCYYLMMTYPDGKE